MSSRQTCRRASSFSPGRAGSISANIGAITPGHPSRMSESVPSKSKSTCVMPGRGAKPALNSTSPANGADLIGIKTQHIGPPPQVNGLGTPRQMGGETEFLRLDDKASLALLFRVPKRFARKAGLRNSVRSWSACAPAPLSAWRACCVQEPPHLLWRSLCRANPHHGNSLRIPSLKIRPFWQKNQGPTKNILHFFLSFFGFLEFFPLQPIAFQPQAAIRPLQKKSCLKTDGRFSVCSGICHNRPMNDGIVQWEMGREKPRRHSDRPAYAGPKDSEFTRPPTAIQPTPVAAGTSQYK